MRPTMYSAEEKIASQRYSSIKSRVIKLRDIKSESEPVKMETSSEELFEFYESTDSKRPRGQSLEVERKEDTKYTEENCELCCYWCNNAKSDIFSFDEFKKIGQAIGLVIKEKLREERLY
jgi:hypothetical protein